MSPCPRVALLFCRIIFHSDLRHQLHSEETIVTREEFVGISFIIISRGSSFVGGRMFWLRNFRAKIRHYLTTLDVFFMCQPIRESHVPLDVLLPGSILVILPVSDSWPCSCRRSLIGPISGSLMVILTAWGIISSLTICSFLGLWISPSSWPTTSFGEMYRRRIGSRVGIVGVDWVTFSRDAAYLGVFIG